MATDIAPVLGHAACFTQAGVGAAPGYDMIDLRRSLGVGLQEGVIDSGSYKVTQRAAGGAAMFVDIAASTGDGATVKGDSVTAQGLYYVPPHTTLITEAITAAHATLPRLDQIVLELLDDTHAGGGLNKSRTRVINGTATSGATLDNRTGAAALPSSCLRLADVLVAPADTSITNSEIRDRRPWARGAFRSRTHASGNLTTTSTAFAILSAATLGARLEVAGNPVEMTLQGWWDNNTAGNNNSVSPRLDGSAIASQIDYFISRHNVAGEIVGITVRFVFVPAAGSHLFEWAWREGLAGTATFAGTASSPIIVTYRELLIQDASND